MMGVNGFRDSAHAMLKTPRSSGEQLKNIAMPRFRYGTSASLQTDLVRISKLEQIAAANLWHLLPGRERIRGCMDCGPAKLSMEGLE